MDFGSMFGDGALRGLDFSAEALHQTSVAMEMYYGERAVAKDPMILPGYALNAKSKRMVMMQATN